MSRGNNNPFPGVGTQWDIQRENKWRTATITRHGQSDGRRRIHYKYADNGRETSMFYELGFEYPSSARPYILAPVAPVVPVADPSLSLQEAEAAIRTLVDAVVMLEKIKSKLPA